MARSSSLPARSRGALRVVLSLVAASSAVACSSARTQPKQPELRVLRLDQALDESPDEVELGGSDVTHTALLAKLHEMAEDSNVKGLLLELGPLHGAWARQTDLRDALGELRKAKKPVHCYFEDTDNSGYALLARVCDRISMSPAGMLDLVGVSAETFYARDFLQLLGLRADLIQIGRFKGAADPVTREDMPEEVRTNLGALLDDLEAEVTGALAARNKLSPAAAQALIDRGPFGAGEARAAGLVDDVGFDDEARAHAKTAAKAQRVSEEKLSEETDSPGLLDLLRALLGGHEKEQAKGKRLVLAYLSGTITVGSVDGLHGAHARAFVRAMRKFADDPDVRAVVLRIDSPGGSVLASDMMWHAVRRVAKKKPIVVSIGDMAASGGYYVASAATEIMAQDLSIVGSIGVVGGKLVVADLAERAGVRFVRLARGKHAGWANASAPFTDEERADFEAELRAGYARFLRRISEGRHMPVERIEPLAAGRIMSGRRARAGGLVDSLGGLRAALASARKRGKLPDDAKIETWPERPSLLQMLSELTGAQALHAASFAGLHPDGLPQLLLAGEARRAAVMPFTLTLE